MKNPKIHFSIFLVLFLTVLIVLPVLAASDEDSTDCKIGSLLKRQINKKTTNSHYLNSIKESKDELVKVIVIMNSGHLSELPENLLQDLKSRVEQLGGRIDKHAYNNVQVWINIDKIEELSKWEAVQFIKLPFVPEPQGVISEGVGVIGASYWQSRRVTGEGVRVGIIDIGFQGYTSLRGTELPLTVTVLYNASLSAFNSSPHGTACAEIVYDVAPDAEMFLANIGDAEVDFHNSLNWFLSQGVDLISSSISINMKYICEVAYYALAYSSDSRYLISQLQQIENLKQQWNTTIDTVTDLGTMWIQASGNDADNQWSGMFVDSEGDTFLNFSAGINKNEIIITSYDQNMYILMQWGQDNTYDDYDLYILDETNAIVARSEKRQSTFQYGMEACGLIPYPGKRYYIAIRNHSAYPQEITIVLGTSSAYLEYKNPQGTILLDEPAPNKNVITVGAVPYSNSGTIEVFSSQGPNADGNIKPDLVAPDGISTYTYGEKVFFGTSPSAPHVAGVCALVKEACPMWGPAQIKQYLELNAIDLGASGKDNVFGSGLVSLPVNFPNSFYAYYLPFFKRDTTHYTSIALRNNSQEMAANITATVYSRSGTVMQRVPKIIQQSGQTAFVFGSGESGWVMVTSDQPLTGLAWTGEIRGGWPLYMANVNVIPFLATALIVPHVAQDSQWDTIIYICNPHNTATSIMLTFVNIYGENIVSGNYTIPAFGSGEYAVADLIGQGNSFSSGSVRISSTKSVAAFALYYDIDKVAGGTCYAGISAVAVTR